MDFSTLADEIAALAHRCWCKEMIEEGWRLGPIIDREAKTHDAIKPYEELSAFDKEQLRKHAVHERAEAELARIAADMLVERELSMRDVHEGMEVRLAADEDREIGRITSWAVADENTGRLASISVEWPDGTTIRYSPAHGVVIPADWPDD